MRTFYLGDIHANFQLINQYVDKFSIKDAYIIQVGDFGVGFSSLEKEKRALEYINTKLVKNNVILLAIRGNHDYKPYFDNDPFGFSNIKLIPDYTIMDINGKNILFMGGAVSVDRMYRYTKAQARGDFRVHGNESYWIDEVFVLDNVKLGLMKNIDIIVTHTSPDYCIPDNSNGFGGFVDGIIRNTGDVALKTDLLFERNQLTNAFHTLLMNGNNPTHHYYGHFHKSDSINMNGIKHRLLNVGELWEERED